MDSFTCHRGSFPGKHAKGSTDRCPIYWYHQRTNTLISKFVSAWWFKIVFEKYFNFRWNLFAEFECFTYRHMLLKFSRNMYIISNYAAVTRREGSSTCHILPAVLIIASMMITNVIILQGLSQIYLGNCSLCPD